MTEKLARGFGRALFTLVIVSAMVMSLLRVATAADAQDDWLAIEDTELGKAAYEVLARAQALSIANDREYCGYIGFDDRDTLRASQPRAGGRDYCEPDAPESWELIASYHTHGSYDPDAASEWPSSDDVIGDMEEDVDGFLSTPGGRFWFIDGIEGVAYQLGGPGSFPRDPNFQAEIDPPLESYTLQELRDIE